MFQHKSHRKSHHHSNNQRNTKYLQSATIVDGEGTKKKNPILSKALTTPRFSPFVDIRPSASNMTIATASLSKLSPNMIVNNFGSTLYVVNIAITVTGSVAERVAPSWRAIGRDNADRDSRPIFVHSQTRSLYRQPGRGKENYPTTTAEINVPANANVRILQMFLKKFA